MPKLTTQTCKLTVTALRSRRTLLVSQLKDTTLLATQILVRMCNIDPSESTNLKNLRGVIVALRDDEEQFNRFVFALTSEYNNLAFIIEMLSTTVVELLQLQDYTVRHSNGLYIVDPLRKLYHHLLKEFYSSPVLLLDDDVHGHHARILRDSIETFADTLVVLRNPFGLTSANLGLQDTMEEDGSDDAKVDVDDMLTDSNNLGHPQQPSKFDLVEMLQSTTVTGNDSVRRQREMRRVLL
jgi:hypothetical protein